MTHTTIVHIVTPSDRGHAFLKRMAEEIKTEGLEMNPEIKINIDGDIEIHIENNN